MQSQFCQQNDCYELTSTDQVSLLSGRNLLGNWKVKGQYLNNTQVFEQKAGILFVVCIYW